MLGSLTNSFAPKAKAMKIEELTPRNLGARRIRMTWGPYKIKGANVCHHSVAHSYSRFKDRTMANMITPNRAPPNLAIPSPWMEGAPVTTSAPIPTSQRM
jgi:hypothetical protein